MICVLKDLGALLGDEGAGQAGEGWAPSSQKTGFLWHGRPRRQPGGDEGG